MKIASKVNVSYRIVVVSQRVSEGAADATSTNEWRIAEAYTQAIAGRVGKNVKVELVDRLKSISSTLQLVINHGLLSAPAVLVFRSPGLDSTPTQTVGVWRFLPATDDLVNLVS